MDLREAAGFRARRHPWEVARFRFFHDVLAEAGALSAPADVLDVGSGDAWFASQLSSRVAKQSTITCWDAGYEDGQLPEVDPAVLLVNERPAARKDVILLLDVLEHVEDDAGFLSTLIRENARRGARVLVSVPAWQALFSTHDEYLHHHRRYAPARGRALLRGAGLTIVREGGLFHSLLLPRAVATAKERVQTALGRPPRQTESVSWTGGALVTGVIGAALAADNAVSKALARYGVRAPGLSWWALCTAP